MGSRLFDEIREQRGLAYSVYSLSHAFADVGILQLSAGLESGKCVEAYQRMREIVDELRTDGPDPRRRSSAPAPTPPAARVLAFENTNAVARHVAQQARGVRRRAGSRRGDRGAGRGHPRRRAPRSPRGISEELAVACVGPHDAIDEFAPATTRCEHLPDAAASAIMRAW